MVIMALDHTRDYFSNYTHNPLDLDHAGAAMFLTRWLTHFCAPVFVFLSGTSAYLSGQRSGTKGHLSKQLLLRGLWLVVLELTVVRFGWTFNFDYSDLWLQVIWMIGVAMICLALMVHLPLWLLTGISLVMVAGHNLLDGLSTAQMGNWWMVLHEEGGFEFAGIQLYVLYPLIPWIGVMGAGYAFGHLLQKRPAACRNKCLLLGAGMIVAFLILRGLDVYGEPSPRQIYSHWWQTALSFVNCTKYPPSLLFLLMTLGPAILALPLLDNRTGSLSKIFIVFGRVPLFFYILHIYLIHTTALMVGVAMGFPWQLFTVNDFMYNITGWGFGLPGVYAFWLLMLLLSYLPCRWMMGLKARSKGWWKAYI